MINTKNVGIADMKIALGSEKLITFALGSCIGIALYDPVKKMAALIHIMLPNAMSNPPDNVYKYADTAIYETIRKMCLVGCLKGRLTAKIAGGAKMFNMPGANNLLGTIGERNIQMVTEILAKSGIRITGREVGGSSARTMVVDPATGGATIRMPGKPEVQF